MAESQSNRALAQINEEWRVVEGFPHYEVSNTGRIRSCRASAAQDTRTKALRWRELRPVASKKDNYYRVKMFSRKGENRSVLLHRLIAIAFLGPSPESKPFVNHKDGNKQNNRIDNLEWSSRSENNRHAYDMELNSQAYRRHLTMDQAREVRRLYAAGHRQVDIAGQMCVKTKIVSSIIKGTRYRETRISSGLRAILPPTRQEEGQR